jgi:hypothetical protein
MENKGFITLSRGFFEHDFWAEQREYSKACAWLDLIRMAAWKDTKRIIGNKSIRLERGSLYASQRFLAERWGWSTKKVRAFLVLLEKESMVVVKRNREGITISLTKYGEYNANPQSKEPQKNHQGTAKEPQKNREGTKVESSKQVKEVNQVCEPAHGEPLISLDQARSSSPQVGVNPDVAEAWWYHRDARGWLDTRGNPIRNWRSDLKSFSLSHGEIAARQGNGATPAEPEKPKRGTVPKDVWQDLWRKYFNTTPPAQLDKETRDALLENSVEFRNIYYRRTSRA